MHIRTDMRTAAERAQTFLGRAERTLAAERLSAPATRANSARNVRAGPDRHTRWRPAREALWKLLDPHLAAGMGVAIVGAGNGDDLPLTRIAERAERVALIDLDPRSARWARRRQPRRQRRRIEVIEHDVTAGAADAVAIAAARGEVPPNPLVPEAPLPGAPFDLVIGDLFYSQLLYPALVDLGVPEPRRGAFLNRYAPILTRSVVARMHVSAPDGGVFHIHDPLAWWAGHSQPVSIAEILAASQRDCGEALRLIARGAGPRESDPRAALSAFGIPVQATALWHWPFSPGIDYLACATFAEGSQPAGSERSTVGSGVGQSQHRVD